MRRTLLKRKSPLRSRPKQRPQNIQRDVWKQPIWGRCENCGEIDVRPLHGHHVVARQVIRRAGGEEYDPHVRMNLCESCHFNHEYGQKNRKIPLSKVPERAIAFTVDLLGEHGATAYFRRHYGGER